MSCYLSASTKANLNFPFDLIKYLYNNCYMYSQFFSLDNINSTFVLALKKHNDWIDMFHHFRFKFIRGINLNDICLEKLLN